MTAADRRAMAAQRERELARKSELAETRRQAEARRYYCRMRPCFQCDSFGACAHREPGIMALSADVLIREGREAGRRAGGGR